MSLCLKSSVLFLSAAFAVAAHAAPVDNAELIETMKRMQERIDQLERQLNTIQKASPPPSAPVMSTQADPKATRAANTEGKAYVEVGDLPGSFKLPGTNTSMKIYGHATVHGTYDIGARANYANVGWGGSLWAQPLDGTASANRTGQTFLTARGSRFGFITQTPSNTFGRILTKVEGDFDGGWAAYGGETQTNVRLREAYIQAGNLLAGQTFSTFTDLATTPDIVEWNATGIQPTIRQAMFRYAIPMGSARVDLAVENSIGSTWPKAPIADYDKNVDYVARFDQKTSWGHFSLRGVLIDYKNDKNEKWGYGLAASTRINITPADNLVVLVAGGDGVGRYMYNGATQGAVSVGNSIELWSAIGAHMGYTHLWSEKFRTSIVGAYTHFDDNPSANAAARANIPASFGSDFYPNKQIRQAWLSAYYTPEKNFDIGLDFTYGRRHTFGGNAGPEEGTMKRMTGMVRYRFD